MKDLTLALIVPLLLLGTACSSNGGSGTGGAAGEGGTSTGSGGSSSSGSSSGGSSSGGKSSTGGSSSAGSSSGGKSTGGTGSGSGSGTCGPFCNKLMQLDCPNDPASGCEAGCEAAIDTAASEGCGAQFEAIFECWGALPATEWSCNADGQAEPSLDSCDPEFMAFLECSTG
jgi:hypothetical protein